MKLRPGEHQAQLPQTKITVDHLDFVDSNLGAAVGMPGMEVGMAMVVEIHGDRDSEEAADRRHGLDLRGAFGRLRLFSIARAMLRQLRNSAKCRNSSLAIVLRDVELEQHAPVKAQV
jgi:hypothetical protein